VRLLCSLLLVAVPAAASPLVLEGEVPEEGDFFHLEFTVPEGTAELEIRHSDLSDANILDWGLWSPAGFRGWGGGNPEPIVVGERAASRSYLAGPLPAGSWQVVVGKARVVERPARYRVEIALRQHATLPPQPERRPYAHVPALQTGRRWYGGDFHVHTLESGDARPTLDEVAALARARGLDFVALSDHNTTAQLDFIPDAQARHPALLLVPSVEFTTYKGHGNGFGATAYVDHRLGHEGWTLGQAVEAFTAQGALFTLNHPTLDIGSGCIGCAWTLPVPKEGVFAVEIGVGGWDGTGALFSEAAIAFWDRLLDKGLHASPVGGSDDHRAGVNLNQTQSPIGNPTTLVLADELSVPALVEAVRLGRTVVKLRGPDDPMVVLEADGPMQQDTVVAKASGFTATVTGGQGQLLRWVQDGLPVESVAITSDPFVHRRELAAPLRGETRVRAEVLVDHRPRTITGHLWLSRVYPPEQVEPELRQRALPGTCAVAGGGLAWLLACAALVFLARRRRSFQ
jgi:hypothetical protein